MVQPGIPKGIKWANYAEQWIDGSALKPESKRFYRMVLRQFFRQFTDLPASHEEIQKWATGLRRVKGAGRRGPLPSMRYSAKTKYYKVIRKFYAWLKYDYNFGASDPRYIPRWRDSIPELPYKGFGPHKYKKWRSWKGNS